MLKSTPLALRLRLCLSVTLVSTTVFAAARLAAQAPMTLAYQVTHSVNIDPSLSPDGKSMVYISEVAGREQLFTAMVDGSDPRQITHGEADHEDPAWSPDGRKIAFVHKEGDIEQIYLMDADGSGVEPLTPVNIRTIHPAWSPDGTRVAYCTDDDLKPPKKNDSDIYAIDIASRRNIRLIAGGVNTYPSWSPDGRRFAFRRMVGESDSEVFVANIDGSEAQNITNNPAFDGWPAWSPDGMKIAFASNRNRSYEIFVMNPDGSGVEKVAANEGRATAPQWSKDGKTLFFPICMKVAFTYNCEVYAARLNALLR
jgi:TolB protein